MTHGTASNPYASPQLQDAISRLEKMHVEAREEVLQQEYLTSQGEPEKALREAQQQAQRTGQALRWARGQALGRFLFLPLLLLKYSALLFAADFGFELWDTYTTQVTPTPDFKAMAINSVETALFAGTIFGLMEWWNGRRAYKKLLEPVQSKVE